MYNSLFKLKIHNFYKFSGLKFNINKCFYTTSLNDKFIIHNNIVLNIKSIDTNIHNIKKHNRKLRNFNLLNDSWDHIKKYDHVCVNLHESDLNFINLYITGVNDKKNRYLLRRIRKQYNEYVTVMNSVNKFNKNFFLFGLHRKSELANFGDVVMTNKNEIPKLFYLILAHTNNLLNSEKALGELQRLCPNIYKLVITKKSNYYLNKLMGFISGLNSNKRMDVLVILDGYLQPHLVHLLNNICSANALNAGFNATGTSGTDNSSLNINLMEDLSHMESVNMRNWSFFLLSYIILPLTLCFVAIIYALSQYVYHLKRGKFVSITIRDDVDDEVANERNKKLKLNKNIQFYNPQRD